MAETTAQAGSTVRPLPDPGAWTIDTNHSFIMFTVEHFRVAFARGIAGGTTGVITVGQEPADTSVSAVIDATTLTTANAQRDERMLGPDLLDVERFPTIEFTSTSLAGRGENRYELSGELTIRDVTLPVTLDLVFNGVMIDTRDRTRMGLTATTEIQRDEFGAGEWGYAALVGGGYMVPHAVKVTLDIEATKDETAPEA